jgi:hypothetical protein
MLQQEAKVYSAPSAPLAVGACQHQLHVHRALLVELLSGCLLQVVQLLAIPGHSVVVLTITTKQNNNK